MSRVIPVYAAEDGDRTLESLALLLPGGKRADAGGGYVVGLDVLGSGGNPSRVAEFDFHSRSVPAGGLVVLTGPQRLGRVLGAGSMLVADVSPYGSAGVDAQMSVQAVIGTSVRPPSHRAGTPGLRDPSDAQSQHSSRVGVGDRVVVVPVVRIGDDDGAAAYGEYLASNQDVTSATYVDGSVSVRVSLPSWATRAVVSVQVDVTVLGLVGAGTFFLSIGDGSADRVEQAETTSTTSGTSLSASYRSVVWRGATFRPRFKMATNNVRVSIQSIGATALFS